MIKNKYLIFSVILLFAFNVTVNAYKCAYDAFDKTGSFEVKEDDIEVSGSRFDWILDYDIDSNASESELIETLKNSCPDYVYICSHYTTWSNIIIDGVTTATRYSFIINGNLINSFSDKISLSYMFSHGFAQYIATVFPEDCRIASVNKEQTTGIINSNLFTCTYYENRIEIIKSLNCQDKSSNCTSSQNKEYNDVKTELKSWCNSITEYADSVNPCMEKCLKLSNDLGIKEINNYECGFSEKLFAWIINILRWIKYILPVFVIIFGILDFMKAIGADKDDEMKKAQKRFVTRLISAALVFIIPLIIEFILSKMGFEANGCGIFNFK